ncbi:MAG: hypothetical protein WDN28_29100 [Chthoniobacter sp.]
MKRKRRRTARDERRHRQSGTLELLAERDHRRKGGFVERAPFRLVGFVNVSVVGVQARRLQTGRRRGEPVELQGLVSRTNAGAILPAIQVEEDIQHQVLLHRGGTQSIAAPSVIDQRGEMRARILQRERAQSGDVRPHRRHREQHIRRARLCAHLRLGDRGALEFPDAERHLPRDERPELVRLHMRPQSLRPHGDLEHAPQVGFDAFFKQQQRRGGDFGFIRESEPVHAD